MDRLESGHTAEDFALAYLKHNGMRLLARHFRAGKAEVDLVMQDGPDVVFVEVKFRGAGSAARSGESVSRAQRLRLEQAAAVWLMRRGLSGLRFDVVAIDESREGWKLEHHRGAFMGSGRISI